MPRADKKEKIKPLPEARSYNIKKIIMGKEEVTFRNFSDVIEFTAKVIQAGLRNELSVDRCRSTNSATGTVLKAFELKLSYEEISELRREIEDYKRNGKKKNKKQRAGNPNLHNSYTDKVHH